MSSGHGSSIVLSLGRSTRVRLSASARAWRNRVMSSSGEGKRAPSACQVAKDLEAGGAC